MMVERRCLWKFENGGVTLSVGHGDRQGSTVAPPRYRCAVDGPVSLPLATARGGCVVLRTGSTLDAFCCRWLVCFFLFPTNLLARQVKPLIGAGYRLTCSDRLWIGLDGVPSEL